MKGENGFMNNMKLMGSLILSALAATLKASRGL
jgi:hypothetical protein